MKNLKFLYILFIIIAGCTSSESNQNSDEKNEDNLSHNDEHIEVSQTQFETANFELGKADSLSFSNKVSVRGSIDVPPKNKASVSTFFEGYVSETSLLIGDMVDKGDVLAELSNPDYITIQQDYVENNARLEFLESEFQRKKNLYDDQVISQKVFQETRSLYKAAQAKDNALKKKIQLMNLSSKRILDGHFSEKIKIYSPISGKISKMFISQGTYVAKSEPMMEIIDTDHVHLELKVFEKDLNFIKSDQAVEFQIPEISDSIYEGYVRLIGAEIESDRSIKVHAHPKEESERFKVGMFVKASFNKNTKKQLALPESAFADLDGHTYVLKLKQQDDDHYVFEKIEVEKTEQQNSFKPLITSAEIDMNTVFLTKGTFDLLTGDSAGHSH
ncbi:MAG: efflux RND transporter periplasmic adaptor subunit [Psychroflexus halocasei]